MSLAEMFAVTELMHEGTLAEQTYDHLLIYKQLPHYNNNVQYAGRAEIRSPSHLQAITTLQQQRTVRWQSRHTITLSKHNYHNKLVGD